ncbi:MAG: hypothetical protein M4579_006453 [Chaenotheca gracillima]|nr:MAG: hypothetical protein M4579_006453 [Chaenotheca gracillima]
MSIQRILTTTLFLLFSLKAQATANCFGASNGVPPAGISDLYVDDCGHKGLWFTDSNYEGWNVYYDRTDDDLGFNAVTSCSDIAGDVRNLLSQCPNGGGLLHHNPVNIYGMVIVEKIGGPNTPPIPIHHYHGP